jgi:hypothetical protein
MFEGTPVASHLVIDDQIFVNATDKRDPEMEQIKKTLIQQAKHQPTWGQYLPKCFVPLELEIAALVRKGVALITMNDMKKINSQQQDNSFPIHYVQYVCFLSVSLTENLVSNNGLEGINQMCWHKYNMLIQV